MRPNDELRKVMKGNKVPQWRVAEELGIAESTFVVKMRHELPEELKARAFEAVEKLSKEGE